MFYKNLIPVIILFVSVIGCSQDDASADETDIKKLSVSKDSVLFTIEDANFEATFSEINESGRGAADGSRVFQRSGGLRYVLGELYTDTHIEFDNNPYIRQNYKIDLKWSSGIRFETVRDTSISKIKEMLGYTTTSDSTTHQVYMFSVINASKLEIAANQNSLPAGVNFKSTIENGIWNIIATLPLFANELDKKLNNRVKTTISNDSLYKFEISLQGNTDDLRQQLENKYGLILESKQEPVELLTITFNES